VLVEHARGLKVLPAPPSPEMAEEVTTDALLKILEHLRYRFAYVVIDTPSHLDDSTIAIFEQADLILSISTQDIPAINNTRLFHNALHSLGIPREKICQVMNNVERRNRITQESVEEHLKMAVLASLPHDGQAVKKSINQGKPLALNGNTNSYTRSLVDLVGHVKERIMAEATDQIED
jgi:pilus assembly protein CpaE